MKEIIMLKSRDGTKSYLKRLSEEDPKTYILNTEIETVRVGKDDKGYVFVDPSGGPFIAEGSYLYDADAKVKSIDLLEGQGFTITFE